MGVGAGLVGGGPPIEISQARNLNALMWEQAQRAQPYSVSLGTNLNAVATGSIVASLFGRTAHTLELNGTFTLTVNFMGSEDGENFVALTPSSILAGTATGADITAAGIYLFRVPLVYARLDVTAYTSGSANSLLISTRL